MPNDLKKELLRDAVEELCRGIEHESAVNKEEGKGLAVKFTDGAVEDIVEILSKDPDEADAESLESELELIKALNNYDQEVLIISYHSVLYGDAVEIDPNLPEGPPERWGYIPYDNETGWTFGATWTDAHLFLDDEENEPWICVVQTKKYVDADKGWYKEYYTQELDKATDLEDIDYYQSQLRKLDSNYQNSIRTQNLPDGVEYLTEEGLILGVRLWLRRYVPHLADIRIKAVVPQYMLE